MTLQFILYLTTFWLVILHYLDSAKEQEWTDKVFLGSYPFWLTTAAVLMAVPLIGMPFVYEQTMTGHVMALLTGIGGLGAGGYHIPMHYLKKSEVCRNNLSYVLMLLLTLASMALIIDTLIIM
jgi:hypothetical protein